VSRLQLDYEGHALVIGLDDPDDKVNKLNESLLAEFTEALDRAEKDDECKAVALISLKPEGFIAGADIEMFRGFVEPGQARDVALRGQALLNRIADFPKPIVAGVHGAAVGGGLETILACHGRIASDDPKTLFGLPEVKLGLLPGLGGTQRLPRLIGLPQALDMLLTGKNVYARKARKIGLVDGLIHPPGLRMAAVRHALALAEKPRRRRKWPWRDRLLTGRLGRGLALRLAARKTASQTHGHYPAPFKILDCVRTGLTRGMEAGLAREAELFDELVRSEESRALIALFFAMNAARKNPLAERARPVRKLAVFGAGLMGAGIAEVSIDKNFDVVMKDLDPASVARGERALWRGLQKRVAKRILTPFQRDRILSRLHATTDDADLAGADLAIEAVFEDLAIKREIVALAEARCAPDCVFASNTSSLPIADIAAAAQRPERVLGMHYFSPVAKMPLLEIIATGQTADWALATAIEVGVRQGKHVIVVADGPGFYTTRILGPLLNEAVLLLEEGAGIDALDRAMVRFGFPVGPVALLDEVGIDVGAHVSEVLGPLFAKRGVTPSNVLGKLHRDGYHGRKNDQGFYRYGGKKKKINPRIYQYFGGPQRRTLSEQAMQERLFLAMVNEAVHCLAENVLRSPRDGDLGAVLGLGFPPYLGGPFHYIDRVGAEHVVGRLQALAQQHGPRFQPAAPLLAGARFHSS